MTTPKNKHLTAEDRLIIHEFLNYGYSFSRISNRLGKSRTTVSREVLHHRFQKGSSKKTCEKTDKPPYVCNGCKDKINCRKLQFLYDAGVAHNEYLKLLSVKRQNLKVTKEQIAAINDIVAPLMVHKHHSVNQIFIEHPECLPFSKSTFYRYIDMGLLNVKNIDLARKVRFKVKKEYSYDIQLKVPQEKKLSRMYHHFRDYMEYNPTASVVEMDTVIGTQGGKGGKCFLTLLFRQFNFMLIYLLPYKKSQYVTETFEKIKDVLGDDEFKRLFQVILTDNGSEFSDPESIEISSKTGEKLTSVYYCNPNSSWQKGTLEKNHQYIRYVLPKGTSFSGLTQEDCILLASHINSVPRLSLNNQSPYEAALGFIGTDSISKLGIKSIPVDDIDLSIRLLRG